MRLRLDPSPHDPLTLLPARVHEAQGRDRRAFALFHAARIEGALVWILPAHIPELPLLSGLPRGVSERLHLFQPTTEFDLLWAVEEALRATPVGLVIAEPQQPLSLTAGRRLQLAAEAGKTTGLMLIRTDEGSNAAETRWVCEAAPGSASDSTPHHWSLNKNKKGTLGSWVLNWNGETAAFNLVPEARERYEPAPSSD